MSDLLQMTAELAKAHLGQNPNLSHNEVPEFLRSIHSTLLELSGAASAPADARNMTIEGNAAQAPAALAAPEPIAEANLNTPPLTQAAELAEEAAMIAATPAETDAPVLVAPIRRTEITDKASKALDRWLAERITPEIAKKLDASNPIHPTVFQNHIVCLEDGAVVKLLRPYLQRKKNMTVAQYLTKWGLPHDYPTAPPAYVENKRKAAQAVGLGTKTRMGLGKGKPTNAANKKTASGAAKASAAKPAAAKSAATKAPAAKTAGTKAAAPSGRRGQRRQEVLFPQA